MADAIDRLTAALARPGRDTSDYDLNPQAVLLAGRVLRPAAVLVAFIEGAQGVEVVLTKRASHLQHHPGQIAFPGGKVDATDADAIAAALREAHEEIGLDPAHTRILGTMAAHETVTSFSVTPVLCRITGTFTPVPEAGEVDEVFRVPLAHFIDPARFRIEQRRWRGEWRRYYVVPYGPYYIWGATARILRALADRMTDADNGGLDQG